MFRTLAACAAAATAISSASAQEAPQAPEFEFLYRAVVTLDPTVESGDTPFGHRQYIPITGGTFEGPTIKGEVLPGGWDWQLRRSDGCLDIEADYFLKTDDGVVINIYNSGVVCGPDENGVVPPRVTIPVFEAPIGKYEWLNKRAFVGTIGVDPETAGQAVIITVFQAK